MFIINDSGLLQRFLVMLGTVKPLIGKLLTLIRIPNPTEKRHIVGLSDSDRSHKY
ncbi:hypothetical protein H6G96_03280 [Nostoc sp. FACHB-892]|uniref:hypothetical protein n=1 Tax=Nostoc sp. FACHB-892 TaxID=2692843 RepID=UPI001689C08B|nr:hypothetical protein [Nostoc sp. FACHB-892]MBD2725366.1 hypothetical protein [Nostoc sp. FACHB-892]